MVLSYLTGGYKDKTCEKNQTTKSEWMGILEPKDNIQTLKLSTRLQLKKSHVAYEAKTNVMRLC